MDKLTKLEHLRSASRETKNLIGQVASAAAAAIEELADKKQDAASAISMDKVNTAIREAVGTIETALSEV